LLKAFPKKLSTIMSELLTHVWNCLVQSSQDYVNKVVNSDSALSSSDNAENSTSSDANDYEGIGLSQDEHSTKAQFELF
jgi:hypothetical protein